MLGHAYHQIHCLKAQLIANYHHCSITSTTFSYNLQAVGLDKDIPPLGGVRSVRYSMVIDDGVVKALNVEPDGTGLSCSLAENIVDQIA